MGIPQLNSCCCGCSLQTGTKIIGWISLVANILTAIMFGAGLVAIYYVEDHQENLTPEQKKILEHLPALKAISILLIVVHVVGCVLSLILLLGVYQKKAKMVLIWVLIALTCALIEQLVNIIQIFTLYQAANLYNIVFFLVDIYFILVVYSFYREIQNINNYA
uniref:Uncharacterized protein n=1 Tax=Graphocephala atropunctata TaxID=36148 RepID=A0A1B6KGW0_9HEMI